MAKDTEKLIRQLSLISFLMANRRPVSALEIKREVEGYSSMNEDAFARRFYADRAELESLGISLQVDKPAEGFFEAELYALPRELLPARDRVHRCRARRAAHRPRPPRREFAYAEPLRLALQQVSWGRSSPLSEGEPVPIDVRLSTDRGGRGSPSAWRRSRPRSRAARRSSSTTTRCSATRVERKVDPYHLVFRDGQFYLIGHSHERDAVRVFRLSRIRGKVSYASKAEHDFSPPEDFDRRDYASRAEWQMGGLEGTAQVFVRERIAWLVERDFGKYGTLRKVTKADGVKGRGMVYETEYASIRQLISWVLSWRDNARLIAPKEAATESARALAPARAPPRRVRRGRHRRAARARG